jgi:hypothetical protein
MPNPSIAGEEASTSGYCAEGNITLFLASR